MMREVKKIVSVDFDEVVFMSGVDDFNEYLCSLTNEEYLQDISWEVCGYNNGEINLSVSGYVEDEE